MKFRRISSLMIAATLVLVLLSIGQSSAQVKIGYIDSQKILANYKEALDVQKQLDAKNQEWQQEALKIQEEARQLQQQLESQSLLLSQEKKDEKMKQIQELAMKFQQFQNEKWGQNGEAFRLQQQLMKPIFDKINAVLEKIGKEEKFDYIFDAVAGNIVYASPNQPDLTDRVLEELNKGVQSTSSNAPKK